MPAARIEWKGQDAEGARREIRADRIGRTWSFFVRSGRYADWAPLEDPTVDEWLELLDGVRRRIQRGLLQRDEETRILAQIRQRYPEAGC